MSRQSKGGRLTQSGSRKEGRKPKRQKKEADKKRQTKNKMFKSSLKVLFCVVKA